MPRTPLKCARGNDRPKVITLCGSSKFVEIMAICGWLLERDEHAITMGLHLLPKWYGPNLVADHLAEAEGVSPAMDRLHLRKIDLSDEVFVVNWNYYVGKSTRREVLYAIGQRKAIRWFTHDQLGEKVKRIFLDRMCNG